MSPPIAGRPGRGPSAGGGAPCRGAGPDAPRPDREAPGGDGELAALLVGRPVTHVRWGLDRIEALLDAVGRPERSYRSLHVAGTNGKGSATATAASVLASAGRRVGLYTSPHLVDVRERIRVDGRMVAQPLLDACAARVRPAADRVGATYFEALTAVAFLAFAEAGVEWAAVETGLGGRLDATNALHPAVCGITSIALDHADHLGSSLEAIAAEKAGILEPGAPVVLGPLPVRLRRVFEARARALAAPVARVGQEARLEDVRVRPEGTRFRYRSARWPDGLALRTPLVGRHQAANTAVAVLMLEMLSAAGVRWAGPGEDAGGPEEAAIREGVAGVRIPGRFQRLARADGTWVLDIAHNPAAFRALRATVGRLALPPPLVYLVGVLADKPWETMLRSLAAAGRRTVLTVAPTAPPGRRWDPAAAASAVDPEGVAFEAVTDFDAALRRARELAGRGTVLVVGSAYTVGEALRRLEGEAAGAGDERAGGGGTTAGPGARDSASAGPGEAFDDA